MNFYVVARTGTGTAEDPYRPDLPAGTSFVGIERQGVYLIGTEAWLSQGGSVLAGPLSRLHDRIKQEVEKRGRTIDELNVWRVG